MVLNGELVLFRKILELNDFPNVRLTVLKRMSVYLGQCEQNTVCTITYINLYHQKFAFW